jgi:radical SAM superfamily
MKTKKKKIKSVTLKLGGRCNLKCKHCHNAIIDYEYNPDIIKWIKESGYNKVSFSGGEPTMYLELIKKIMIQLGKEIDYHIVTNATIITDDLIDFFNEYKASVVVSYDGESSERDFSYIPKYNEVKKFDRHGLTSVYYGQNETLLQLQAEVDLFREKYWDDTTQASFYPNFVHQTQLSPNPQVTRETAIDYVMQYGQLIELDFLRLKKIGNIKPLNVLKNAFNEWVRKKDVRGVACFNQNHVNLTISGDLLVCPYNPDTKVGDIYNDIKWDLIEEKYLPKRCHNCKIKDICKCTCVENITTNECYIAKVLHKHTIKLMKKYRYTYEELEKLIDESQIAEGT